MYIIDLVKKISRKSNIAVLVYLAINVIIIIATVFGVSGLPLWESALIGLALYALSLAIALSPFGEWILRIITGCKKLKRQEQIDRLEPLFNEVMSKARTADPSIPDDVKCYINPDKAANAFATGRKTICVTEGLLELPKSQIEATLGHEFGHLAHKDTDLILLITVGNFIVAGMILCVKLFIEFLHCGVVLLSFVFHDGLIIALMSAALRGLSLATVVALTWLWTFIGTALVMKTSRANEYEADRFSSELGYGNEICAALDTICVSCDNKIFANLVNSHPDKNDRIKRLQDMGATYTKVYAD